MCKHPFHSFSPADSFSASCLKLYKMGHILGCPEGVWRVSWRCLGIIWVTLDTVWRVMLSAQLKKKIILGHFNQLRHFLTVANFRRFRAQNAKFQVWFYIWRSPQIKKNPIETGLKIKFPVRIQMDRSYNWDRTSQWALMCISWLPSPATLTHFTVNSLFWLNVRAILICLWTYLYLAPICQYVYLHSDYFRGSAVLFTATAV